MNELSKLRQHIDEIDGKLMPLLARRMELSKEIADCKAKEDIPVLDEQREQEILKKAESFGEEIKTVYLSVLEASRKVQNNK